MAFDFEALRRRPDVEADNLFASDAADRLIIDEAGPALLDAAPGTVVVIGDAYGAITLAAAALYDVAGIRTHQDALSGELALAANARDADLVGCYRSLGLGAELLRGARVVLLRLPRSLDALDEIAELIARYAEPDVHVVAGGMVKHMAVTMNDVLRRHFSSLDITHARQKSRVLIASGPIARPEASWPRRAHDDALDVTVVAHGAAFAGTSVDIGTRFLLANLDDALEGSTTAIDLGCGTGIIAATIARRHPNLRVLATDQSAAAVESARATAAANGVADRVAVVRDDALAARPDASAELIILNPPFHIGATVHVGIAAKLFADAGRVLAPGGELWAVWNSHLGYRGALTRLVGPTRQIARNTKFTVTASKRS